VCKCIDKILFSERARSFGNGILGNEKTDTPTRGCSGGAIILLERILV
jgi:hypothetical protein